MDNNDILEGKITPPAEIYVRLEGYWPQHDLDSVVAKLNELEERIKELEGRLL